VTRLQGAKLERAPFWRLARRVLFSRAMRSLIGVVLLLALPISAVALPLPEEAQPSLAGASQPGPEPAETEWYGWQTLLVDLSWIAVTGAGAASGSNGLVALGLLGYPIGVPIVHGLHGKGGTAVSSFALRLGLPLLAGLVGAGIGSAGESKKNCEELCGFAALAGAYLGLATGALAAILIDAARASAPSDFHFTSADRDSHWFLGASAALVAKSDGGGPGLSLDAEYQTLHWSIRASALGASLRQNFRTATVASASALGARIFGESATALYLGAGVGYLRETSESQFGQTGPGQGAAAVGEAGILFLRDRQWGRAAVALRLTVPLFAETVPIYSCPTPQSCSVSPGSPSFAFASLFFRVLL
jgi:hypothetical protein